MISSFFVCFAVLVLASTASGQFSGYVVNNDRRCVEGSSIALFPTVDECIEACNAAGDRCGGVNVNRLSGECVARSSSCRQIVDENAIFYQKQTSAEATSAPTTSAPVPATTSKGRQSSRKDSASNWASKFEMKIGKRCSGGNLIGSQGRTIDECFAACFGAKDRCSGINVNADGSCEAFAQCTIETVEGAVFYKLSSSYRNKPRRDYTTSEAIRQGYEENVALRCAGGMSQNVGAERGLDNCERECSRNAACRGFNYSFDGENCVLRSAGCEEMPADNSLAYYRKLAN